jgi:hypothetical protein
MSASALATFLKALRDRGYTVDDDPMPSVNSKSRVTYTALVPLRKDINYYQLHLDRIYLQALVSNDPPTWGHSVELESVGYMNGDTWYYLALFDPRHKNVYEVLMWPALRALPQPRPRLRTEEQDRATKDRKKYWTPLLSACSDLNK